MFAVHNSTSPFLNIITQNKGDRKRIGSVDLPADKEVEFKHESGDFGAYKITGFLYDNNGK